jgi:hypothetical protein
MSENNLRADMRPQSQALTVCGRTASPERLEFYLSTMPLVRLSRQFIRQQSVILFLDHPVALTSALF